MDAQHSASFISVTPINLAVPDTQQTAQMGVLSSKYSVTEYHDARMKPDGTSSRRAYAVMLVQKLTLNNPSANSFAALTQYPQYRNYPVLAVQRCTMDPPPQGISCYVDDYYPKTLNASVQTSTNDATSSASASTFQRTSGSNMSETSSYQVSGSADFSIIPSGSMSWTNGLDHSVGLSEGTA
ncbi:MAG: hypothetical protein EOP58_02305 [Sphingomonadales bacterium]|nr:MAG: hypothetical protein EOP58_02305 [Sphingomonadales bacterium]